MENSIFGTLKDGRQVKQYSIKNKHGMEIFFLDYGCRIKNIFLPCKNGNKVDIVQGFDTLEQYEADTSFQGAAVGRYGNRIENASFKINGIEYNLEQTEAPNFLHGNFSDSIFKAQPNGDNCIAFTYISPDKEQGFPGELVVEISYTITDTNELIVDYRAVSSADTHICLTNHTYFNLSGQLDKPIYDQTLKLDASHYLDVREDLIPTGNLIPVEGTPFDFRHTKPFADGINDSADAQIKIAGGYDHCFVFDKGLKMNSAPCAEVKHPESGRAMYIYTSEPAVQLYTTNGKAFPGKNGKNIEHHSAFCLETQHYPNSPNEPDFPSTLLKKGDKYHSATIFRFEF